MVLLGEISVLQEQDCNHWTHYSDQDIESRWQQLQVISVMFDTTYFFSVSLSYLLLIAAPETDFSSKGRLWKSEQSLPGKSPKRTTSQWTSLFLLTFCHFHTESREFKSKVIEINESDSSDLSISFWVFGKDVKGTYLYELFPPLLVKPSLLVVATISWDSAGRVR